MSEEAPDDYLSAAAAVVEAARILDEANKDFKTARERHYAAYGVQQQAEKNLEKALENLKNADTGRRAKT